VPIGMLSFGPTWPISLVKLPMGERKGGAKFTEEKRTWKHAFYENHAFSKDLGKG
jgi:hypothetical protein